MNNNIELQDNERQPCEVWSRVMGYFRPFSEYNHGKKAEFCSRVCFKEEKALTGIDKKSKGGILTTPPHHIILKQ